MTCIEAVKRALHKIGLLPSLYTEAIKDAETDDLVIEREKALGVLAQDKEEFNQSSDKLSAALEEVLRHLRSVGTATADARTLIENMIMMRRKKERS